MVSRPPSRQVSRALVESLEDRLLLTVNPTWQPLNDPDTMGRGSMLEISPYDSHTMLTTGDVFGLGITTDGGLTWQHPTGLTSYVDSDLTFHPTDRNTLWMGTNGGPYKSTDGGKTWTLKRG